MSNENSGKLMIKLGKFIKGEGNEKVQIEGLEMDLASLFTDEMNSSNNSTAVKVTELLLQNFGPALNKAIDMACAREEKYADVRAKESEARILESEARTRSHDASAAESKARTKKYEAELKAIPKS